MNENQLKALKDEKCQDYRTHTYIVYSWALRQSTDGNLVLGRIEGHNKKKGHKVECLLTHNKVTIDHDLMTNRFLCITDRLGRKILDEIKDMPVATLEEVKAARIACLQMLAEHARKEAVPSPTQLQTKLQSAQLELTEAFGGPHVEALRWVSGFLNMSPENRLRAVLLLLYATSEVDKAALQTAKISGLGERVES